MEPLRSRTALLAHALRHADTAYTIHSHSGAHQVTCQSARTDLADLEQRGFPERRVVGRKFEYRAVRDLQERLASAPA